MNLSTSRARSAFTLIEILVVIGITALLSAIILGGFRSFSESNRRSTCASNLAQIYRAARLYSDDLGAFPAYNPNDSKSGGLWLLWGFDDASDPSGIKTPERALATRYLRSTRPFHCPSDPDSTLAVNAAGTLNKRFLSYQIDDNGQQTYQPTRTNSLGDPDYPRQLLHFHPDGYLLDLKTPSNTVITWCKWHRNVGSRPDNVLFFDGSVRRMAIQMKGAGIHNNMMVLVRPYGRKFISRGHIVAAQITDSDENVTATIKRFDGMENGHETFIDGEGNDYDLPDDTVRIEILGQIVAVLGALE